MLWSLRDFVDASLFPHAGLCRGRNHTSTTETLKDYSLHTGYFLLSSNIPTFNPILAVKPIKADWSKLR
jgi:hypothetical protein